ncbi:MAG TPA: galactose oxidase early set domain-containing protein [Geminicoccaceae bacterium]|nr:galactose oxidase early set domain-containing protein [Geminicoccaceae bacterium]
MIGTTELRVPRLLEGASNLAPAGASARHLATNRSISTGVTLGIAVAWLSCLGGGAAEAFHPIPSNPKAVGEIGPLIPFHKDAIHSVLVWTGVNRDKPKVCFWMRPAEYRGTDLVDPLGLSPDLGETGGFIAAYQALVRGGSEFSDRLDRSVQSRILDDIPLDNGLCLDLTHPDAFKNNGKHEIATFDEVREVWVPVLDEEDFDLNRAAFSPAGDAAGLNYNIFCSGHVQLPDGRIAFFGGHYIDGDHGLRKVNIFDPVTETWVDRPMPPLKEEYLKGFPFSEIPEDFPDAENEDNGDPPLPSDMKYQRWYPSATVLPNGLVLILSGTDTVFTATGEFDEKHTTTPEIYDPETDTTIALENTRKVLPNYPLTYVVQTGPGPDDWKVAVTGEMVDEEGNVLSPIPAGQVDAMDQAVGRTYYLDVQAAMAAGDRDVPGENHWELIATALITHHRAGAAQLWELDDTGFAKAQKVAAFGGNNTSGPDFATVEMIDYQEPAPRWRRQEDLLLPVSDNYAAVLPDGRVLIVGGEVDGDAVDLGAPAQSLHYQMFNPRTGNIRALGETPVPRLDHTSMLLLPDASVLVMGTDRTELVADDLIPGVEGDRDMGVPVAQVYKPPYLFKGPRPVIEDAPEEIAYGGSFDVQVSGSSARIGSIVLIMPSPQTHKWDWGNRYVELAFDKGKNGRLSVVAPAAPGLALPGYYMLFVVTYAGVPSEAKLVHFSVPE